MFLVNKNKISLALKLTIIISCFFPSTLLVSRNYRVENKPTLAYLPKIKSGENFLGKSSGFEPTETPVANGGVWVSFKQSPIGERLKVVAKSRDTMGLCVDTDFYGMYRITVNATGKVFDYVNIPGASNFAQAGKPAVPVVTRFLEIPYNYDPQMNPISLSYEILHAEYVELDGYYLTPAQEERVDLPNATDPEYKFDDVIYNTNAFFPGKLVILEGHNQSIILRGHRILGLTLNPIQFNPVTREVRAYTKIEVRINYNRAEQIKPIPSRLFNPNFHAMLTDFILNFDYSPSWELTPFYTSSKDTGAEYLIITHDDFYNEIKPLAIWKEKKGVSTRIVKTSEIDAGGPTATDIKMYIKNIYETWDPAPTYVLLVGDSEFIPTHYLTPHPYPAHGGHEIATDLYYATVDGNDYFPDLYIGRLSVDTTLECSIVVDKILSYEKNPPNNANFYNSATFCAYFQDSGDNRDGYEDRAFILTSEQIRDYLISEGYNVYRIYFASYPAGQNPTNYNNGPTHFYDSGDPLPSDLLWPDFKWDGDRWDIAGNITEGRFLILHRDHGVSRNFYNHKTSNWGGSIDGWVSPSFDTSDITGLANGDLLPVVISIECQCGWFDGEIDQNNDADLTNNFESFCETFVRQNGGGAIAAIGASRSSYSGLNDDFAHGLFDAIWPEFNPDFAGGELFQLGQILTYGKIYLAALRGYRGSLVQETFELFHLFGCPEMAIYTKEPQSMTVSFPDTIGSGGVQKFVVKVQSNQNPVPNAKICLQKENEVYAVKYTDAFGNAYFSVMPNNGGEMNITVTKHNYIPYEGIITVTNNGAAIRIDPATSYTGYPFTLTGGGFSSSETVDIIFGSTTFTKTATSSGSISLSDDIPTLTPGEIINIKAVGQSSGRTAVCVFRCLSAAQVCDPYIYSQWDSTTWHLNPLGNDPRWDNPEIQLYEQGTWDTVASNDLEVGKTYTIRATIHNSLDIEATNTEVTFKWAFFGGGQKTWNLIGTDTINVPGLGTKTAEVDWTPSVTGHNCIKVLIDQYWDENTENNKGQENTQVAPASSPVVINFILHNPLETSELIYLETKLVEGPEIWSATITRDYPQVLGPDEEYEVKLVIDVPEDVNNGTSGYYVVNAYIGDTLIGGIEVKAIKSTGGGKTNPFSVPFAVIVCAIVIEPALIIWVQRKRKLKEYQN